MKNILTAAQAFLADEDGVTAIEYGLIAALIGVAIAGAASSLGGSIKTLFSEIALKIKATVS